MMRTEFENGTFTVFPAGRIDSSNAEAVKQEIDGLYAEHAGCPMVMDMTDLDYTSSAGLRDILYFLKKAPSLQLINVSTDVYEVLEMTGFTEMLPVAKAYRRLSVDGCEIIGRGANGTVYRLDPDTIVKVYRSPDCLEDIKHERELARKAFVLGIPTAIPFDVVRVGDTYGSVFELLNAKSFLALVKSEPENTDRYIDMSVEILKKIHATQVDPDDMPDMHAVALHWAEFMRDWLDAADYAKLYAMFDKIEHRKTMLHGDYHFKNIMMMNGEALLIDMDTLCYGAPVFELASVYNAYVGFGVYNSSKIEDFMGLPLAECSQIWQKTLARYMETDDPAALQAAENKAKIVGYVRIIRRSIRRGAMDDPAWKAETMQYLQELHSLIAAVDDLNL